MSESCATIKLAVLIERAIGGLGQRNREEIGAEATKTPPASFELAFAYGSFQLDQNVRPSIKYLVVFHGRVPTDWKKEALAGALSILNIRRENRATVLKPELEMAISSLLQRRDVTAILPTGFGKSMIFTVFAMAKEKMSSSKTRTIAMSPLKSTLDDQISEMLSLSCTEMELTTATVNLLRESPPQLSLLLGVRE